MAIGKTPLPALLRRYAHLAYGLTGHSLPESLAIAAKPARPADPLKKP
jgi:hypothetical protein